MPEHHIEIRRGVLPGTLLMNGALKRVCVVEHEISGQLLRDIDRVRKRARISRRSWLMRAVLNQLRLEQEAEQRADETRAAEVRERAPVTTFRDAIREVPGQATA